MNKGSLFRPAATYNASYSFKPAAYADGQTTRTVLSIIPILFVVGVLVIVTAMILLGGS